MEGGRALTGSWEMGSLIVSVYYGRSSIKATKRELSSKHKSAARLVLQVLLRQG